MTKLPNICYAALFLVSKTKYKKKEIKKNVRGHSTTHSQSDFFLLAVGKSNGIF